MDAAPGRLAVAASTRPIRLSRSNAHRRSLPLPALAPSLHHCARPRHRTPWPPYPDEARVFRPPPLEAALPSLVATAPPTPRSRRSALAGSDSRCALHSSIYLAPTARRATPVVCSIGGIGAREAGAQPRRHGSARTRRCGSRGPSTRASPGGHGARGHGPRGREVARPVHSASARLPPCYPGSLSFSLAASHALARFPRRARTLLRAVDPNVLFSLALAPRSPARGPGRAVKPDVHQAPITLSALARCCLQSRSFRGSHDRSRSHRRLRTPGAQVLVGPSPATSTQQVCSPLLFPLCCAKPSIRTLAPCPVALTPPPSAVPHPATVAASRRRCTPGAQVLVGPFTGDGHPTGYEAYMCTPNVFYWICVCYSVCFDILCSECVLALVLPILPTLACFDLLCPCGQANGIFAAAAANLLFLC
ncbi:uncharacterized protein [Miscanthus floridulus]|uniref:uncharacterized protein n=1 Tax=Miscanthus floridulus TaxID=154761 RepID=UPI0034580721